jgi:hypothetical protein
MRPYAIASVILIVAGAILACCPSAVAMLFVHDDIGATLRSFSYAGVFVMVVGLVVAVTGFVREWLNSR